MLSVPFVIFRIKVVADWLLVNVDNKLSQYVFSPILTVLFPTLVVNTT